MKECLFCEQKIVGRSDKKFCSPQCRSTYNNQLNSSSINLIRNVNNLLRKNRRILKGLNPKGKRTIKRQVLIDHGFNFEFYTNSYTTKIGNTYRFCYDQGYLALENNRVALVERKEYV